jgi:hypothetical protein
MITPTNKTSSYTQLALIVALSSCLLQAAAASDYGWAAVDLVADPANPDEGPSLEPADPAAPEPNKFNQAGKSTWTEPCEVCEGKYALGVDSCTRCNGDGYEIKGEHDALENRVRRRLPGWLDSVCDVANWAGNKANEFLNKMEPSGKQVLGNVHVTRAGSPEVNGWYVRHTSGMPSFLKNGKRKMTQKEFTEASGGRPWFEKRSAYGSGPVQNLYGNFAIFCAKSWLIMNSKGIYYANPTINGEAPRSPKKNGWKVMPQSSFYGTRVDLGKGSMPKVRVNLRRRLTKSAFPPFAALAQDIQEQ